MHIAPQSRPRTPLPPAAAAVRPPPGGRPLPPDVSARARAIGLRRFNALSMTDIGFLFGMMLVIIWALDPGRVYLDQIPNVKHFPVVLVLGSVGLAIFGAKLNQPWGQPAVYSLLDAARDFKWLLTFALFVIGGSLIAKYGRGINETFLTMGVFSLAAPITAWFIRNSSQPARCQRLLVVAYIFGALLSATFQIKSFGAGEIFHNREHLVIPVLGAALYFLPGVFAKVVGVGVIVAVGASGGKNTGYIVVLLTLGMLALIGVGHRVAKREVGTEKLLIKLAVIVALVASMAGLFFAYTKFQKLLPTGNPTYRLHTYELAIDRFLDSPVWGEAFLDASVERFDLFKVGTATQVLPTHSDPLDIAAHGGIIGIGCWLMALAPLLLRCWRSVLGGRGPPGGGSPVVFHVYLFIVTCGLFVCAVNPILNIPNQAFAFWAALGALMTMSDANRPDPA